MLPENGLNAINFVSASDLIDQNHIKFGLLPLDELIPEGVPLSSLTLIQGELPHSILRSLITKLTVGLLLTNPKFNIAFIDGANLFPYYEIAKEGRRRGKDPSVFFKKIQLSRAFNFHQMTEILINNLPRLIRNNPSIRIVLVPQISSHYFSKEALQYLQYDNLSIEESSLLELTQAVGILKSLVLHYDLLGIMTTSSAPHSRHKPLGGTYLAHSACPIIRVTLTPNSTREEYDLTFTLQKDPARPVMQVSIPSELKKPKKQHIPLTRFW
ncbi:MAG: hypothetical protein ACFFC7_08900 [Candidatus Hermodarchaeota archaeon]